MEEQPAVGPWHESQPRDVASLFSNLAIYWWIAGGWALDLFIGRQTRPHGDLDVGVFRNDVKIALAALSSWDIFEAKAGVLTRLHAGQTPRADVNSLWCRPQTSNHWTLEIMLDERDRDNWVFRRDARIKQPLFTVIRHNPQHIPYLAPEVQLLYKAPGPRPQDEADFDRVAPQLGADARTWLEFALRTVHPEHVWISKLNATHSR
jgi:hypothetical protein